MNESLLKWQKGNPWFVFAFCFALLLFSVINEIGKKNKLYITRKYETMQLWEIKKTEEIRNWTSTLMILGIAGLLKHLRQYWLDFGII